MRSEAFLLRHCVNQYSYMAFLQEGDEGRLEVGLTTDNGQRNEVRIEREDGCWVFGKFIELRGGLHSDKLQVVISIYITIDL